MSAGVLALLREALGDRIDTRDDSTTLIEDISVPRSALPAMFDEIARVERTYGVSIPTVAHAGDGNLHPNLVFQGEEVPPVVWDPADEMFRAALRLGAPASGGEGVRPVRHSQPRQGLRSVPARTRG